MDRQPPEVIRVDSTNAEAAADAIAEGFLDNEIWTWILPNDRHRANLLRRYYRRMIPKVWMDRGAAWVTADGMGAAIWGPPNNWKLSGREEFQELIAMGPVTPATMIRGARLGQLFNAHHPREPHWYLADLAVRPDAQQQGLGSALIAPGLEQCDADGLPAYLETQRESNIPFYARFGFELIGKESVRGGPPAWFMWRPSR